MDLGKIIGTVAPWIGTALGGPIGGAATRELCKAIGLTKDDPSQDEISQAIANATPDQLLALKKADQDFAVQMQTLGFKNVADLEKIAADDRASARDREIKTGDWTPRALAIAVTLGFFGVLVFLMKYDIPATEQNVLNVMLGSLGTAWIAIVTYYFGSSAGSTAKSETIDKLMSNHK